MVGPKPTTRLTAEYRKPIDKSLYVHASSPPQSHTICSVSDTVIFRLDQLEQLGRQDGVDALALHTHQVRPELVHVLLAQVTEQQGAVGRLGPRQIGVEVGAAEFAAVACAWGHQSASPGSHSP